MAYKPATAASHVVSMGCAAWAEVTAVVCAESAVPDFEPVFLHNMDQLHTNQGTAHLLHSVFPSF